MAFVGTAGVTAYAQLQGNIETHDISALLNDRPEPMPEPTQEVPGDPAAGAPLNILVMGSDARTGEYLEAEGDVDGMRSDTTFLVHLSADRSRVDVINIPRDLLVDIPACALSDGSQSSPQNDAMFNSAFSTGGRDGVVPYAAACTIGTFEQMAGFRVDDYVVVDFAGFVDMVDALGGIDVCVPEPVDDTDYTGLVLNAGPQPLLGEQAFLYARVRHGVGDGSDIGRIERQQLVVGAMVRQLLSKNLLTDLPALYGFLNAATSSLTAGPTVGQIPTLAGVGNAMRNVDAGAVSFVTVPFDWAGARVKPNAASAELWAAVAADQPVNPQPVEVPAADGTSTPAVPPADATVPDPGTTEPVPPPTTPELPWQPTTAEQGTSC